MLAQGDLKDDPIVPFSRTSVNLCGGVLLATTAEAKTICARRKYVRSHAPHLVPESVVGAETVLTYAFFDALLYPSIDRFEVFRARQFDGIFGVILENLHPVSDPGGVVRWAAVKGRAYANVNELHCGSLLSGGDDSGGKSVGKRYVWKSRWYLVPRDSISRECDV